MLRVLVGDVGCLGTRAGVAKGKRMRSFHASAPQRFDMFSGISGRIKKLWKGEQPAAAEGTPEAATQESEEPLTQEEKEAVERDDKKLMENITTGKFDLNDYQREITRLVKLAKAKGAFDSVKGKVTSMLGKKEEPDAAMKNLVADFETQIALLKAMTEDEKKNPDFFYDHAFKTKQRIVATVNQTVADFNALMEKYENSRIVYMVLHEVKRRGKEIPTGTDSVMPFVQQNVHLLSDKDKARIKRHTKYGKKK